MCHVDFYWGCMFWFLIGFTSFSSLISYPTTLILFTSGRSVNKISVVSTDFHKPIFWAASCSDVVCLFSWTPLVGRRESQSTIGNPVNTYSLVQCYQGSRDNMSIVLVTFLAAPKPCAEAIQKENELEDRIERRITGQ